MPVPGETASAKSIGRKGGYPYVWVVCPGCKVGRWVAKRCTKAPDYTGMCVGCTSKHPVWDSLGEEGDDGAGKEVE